MTDEDVKLPKPYREKGWTIDEIAKDDLFTADQVRAAVLEAKRDLPPLLFDGYYVWEEGLTDAAKKRTSPENVADVLDAVVRLMRAAAIRSGHSITETKRAEE